MKKITLSLLFLSLSFGVIAQEKEKQQEVGITFNNLNSFTLQYKSGTEKSLWRYNILIGNIRNYSSDNPTNYYNGYYQNSYYYAGTYNTKSANSSSWGVSLGKEFRKPLTKKLNFIYGLDVRFTYGHENREFLDNNLLVKSTFNSFTPAINGIIGFNLKLNKSVLIGVEILPQLSYTKTKQSRGNNNQSTIGDFWDLNLNNNNAKLSIMYQF